MCKRNKWALIFQSCCWNISKCCPIRKKPHAKPDLYIELYTIHTQSLSQIPLKVSFCLELEQSWILKNITLKFYEIFEYFNSLLKIVVLWASVLNEPHQKYLQMHLSIFHVLTCLFIRISKECSEICKIVWIIKLLSKIFSRIKSSFTYKFYI